MRVDNNKNNCIQFGSYRKFKRMFKVCSYSGEEFEPRDTRTLEHIVPKSRGGKKELGNLIVVKRTENCLRSGDPLNEVMEKRPYVLENVLRTLEEMKDTVIDGIKWAEEAKKSFYKETHYDVFK